MSAARCRQRRLTPRHGGRGPSRSAAAPPPPLRWRGSAAAGERGAPGGGGWRRPLAGAAAAGSLGAVGGGRRLCGDLGGRRRVRRAFAAGTRRPLATWRVAALRPPASRCGTLAGGRGSPEDGAAGRRRPQAAPVGVRGRRRQLRGGPTAAGGGGRAATPRPSRGGGSSRTVGGRTSVKGAPTPAASAFEARAATSPRLQEIGLADAAVAGERQRRAASRRRCRRVGGRQGWKVGCGRECRPLVRGAPRRGGGGCQRRRGFPLPGRAGAGGGRRRALGGAGLIRGGRAARRWKGSCRRSSARAPRRDRRRRVDGRPQGAERRLAGGEQCLAVPPFGGAEGRRHAPTLRYLDKLVEDAGAAELRRRCRRLVGAGALPAARSPQEGGAPGGGRRHVPHRRRVGGQASVERVRAFPPMSGQRHIGHTLQKRVSNSPLASSRGG